MAVLVLVAGGTNSNHFILAERHRRPVNNLGTLDLLRGILQHPATLESTQRILQGVLWQTSEGTAVSLTDSFQRSKIGAGIIVGANRRV